MMTDQTPVGDQHTFAPMLQAMGEAVHTIGGAVLSDIAQFGAPADDVRLRERLASLSDATIQLDGTILGDARGLLQALGIDGPPTHDVSFTPDAAERPECPHCHELAEHIRYEGAVLASTTEHVDGSEVASIRSASVASARFLPCGHRFDGITGALSEGDDG